MTKIAGSGSISQRHGSADPVPDQYRNVMDPEYCLKVLSSYTNLGRDSAHSIRYSKPGKFKNFFNDTISREEHKTIYSGLRITGMALSNQSDLMQFWSLASHLIQLCQMGLELVICRLRLGWSRK
jgi:hypothetical protein